MMLNNELGMNSSTNHQDNESHVSLVSLILRANDLNRGATLNPHPA